MHICICQICHSEFQPKKGRANVNKYCSHKCGSIGSSLKTQEQYNKEPKTCACCNDALPYRKRNNKFCDSSCAATYNNSGTRRHGAGPNSCKVCGQPTGSSARKYCSLDCFGQDHLKYQTDEERQKAIKETWRLAQSKYRAKGYRSLDPTADLEKIKEIYRNCPEGYEVDHIVPLSKGGKHHEDNLQYLTLEDNRRKGNRWIG